MRVEGVAPVNYTNNTSRVDNNTEKEKLDLDVGKEKIKTTETRTKDNKDISGPNEDYLKEEIIEKIEEANVDFIAYDRRFEFSIHEKTKQITVKVLDTRTDEVIREIPPEKILDVLSGLWEIAGILVDKKI